MTSFASEKGTLSFDPDTLLVMANVEVDDIGEEKFIFDTGAMASLLSKEFAQKHDFELMETGITGLGVGEGKSQALKLTKVKNLNLGGIEIQDRSLVVMDLSKVLEPVGGEVAGIIGFDILSKYETTFDFKEGEITLVDPSNAPERKDGIDFSLAQNYIYFDVKLEGEGEFPFLFDTGASNCVINKSFAESLNLTQKMDKLKKDTAIGVSGSKEKIQLYEKDKISVDQLHFQDVQVALMDLSKFETLLGKKIYGIIGNSVFKDKTVTINYINQKIYVE